MKIVSEKAGAFVAQFMAKRTVTPEDRKAAREGLERLLKEQDRDTRHACANAIAIMDGEVMSMQNDLYVSKDLAHDACINVKAV
jgi:uncharacterized protein (UPF0147 family)